MNRTRFLMIGVLALALGAFVSLLVYKNLAALDNLSERTDPAATKLMGSRQKRAEASISREAMREPLGDRYIRELILK